MNKTLIIALALACLLAPAYSTQTATYAAIIPLRVTNDCTTNLPVCPTSDTVCATDVTTISTLWAGGNNNDCSAWHTTQAALTPALNSWDYDTTTSNSLDGDFVTCWQAINDLTTSSITSVIAKKWAMCIGNSIATTNALATTALTGSIFSTCISNSTTANSIAANIYTPPCTTLGTCTTEAAAIITALTTGNSNCSTIYTAATTGNSPTAAVFTVPTTFKSTDINCLNAAYMNNSQASSEVIGYINAVQDCMNIGTGATAPTISAQTSAHLNSFDKFLACRIANGCADSTDTNNLVTAPVCPTGDASCATDAAVTVPACSTYNTAATTSGSLWPAAYFTCLKNFFKPTTAYTGNDYMNYGACAYACAADHTQTATKDTTITWTAFATCRANNGCGATAFESHPAQTATPLDSWSALSLLDISPTSSCANSSHFPTTATAAQVSNAFVTCLNMVFNATNLTTNSYAKNYVSCASACLANTAQTTTTSKLPTYGVFATCTSNNGCPITATNFAPVCPNNATTCATNAGYMKSTTNDTCVATIGGGTTGSLLSATDIACLNTAYPNNFGDIITQAWSNCVQNCADQGSAATPSISTSRTYTSEQSCRTSYNCLSNFACATSDTACNADITIFNALISGSAPCGTNYGSYSTLTMTSATTAMTDDYIACINDVYGATTTSTWNATAGTNITTMAAMSYASCRIQCLQSSTVSLGQSSSAGQTANGVFMVASYIAMIVLGLIAFI